MKKIFIILILLLAVSVNAQWVQMSNGIADGVNCLAASEGKLFAGTWVGIYLSTNDGASWTAINNGINCLTMHAIEVSGSNILAASSTPNYWGEVYLSTNNGSSWTLVLNNTKVKTFLIDGPNIFAGADLGLFKSTNNGVSWNNVNPSFSINTLEVSGGNLFAGTGSGVLLSTNNGVNWTIVNNGLYNTNITSFAIKGSNLFAGTASAVFLSTNNGSSWSARINGLENADIKSIAVSDSIIFVGTGHDVSLTTNNGTNWIVKNEGFPIWLAFHSLVIKSNYIFAGNNTPYYPLWRRTISEILLTSIQNISTETPSKYSLSQNYPNPFNPITNVKFSIVNVGDVKLVVYDIQGREVQTLVNERLQPGMYEAAFDGSALNSGVYFYKLISNGFSETKKMLLIK